MEDVIILLCTSELTVKEINLTPRIGLKALMDVASKTKDFTISDVVFGIAPRINAAGRIEHAKKAVEILIEKDRDKAKLFADRIFDFCGT